MNTLRILFDLAEQKPELSNDFLNEAQKQTDKTANEFWKELCNGWQFLADRVNGNISKQENSLINLSFNAQIISQIFYLAGLKNKEIYSKDGLTKEGLRITYNHLGNYALENRLNWYYYSFTGNPFIVSYNYSPVKVYELYKIESERQFKNELKNKKPEQIGEWLNIHLRKFVREGGNKADWIKHTRQFVSRLSIEQQDSFYNWIDANSNELPTKKAKPQQPENTPQSFEELFYNPENAEPCLRILAELQTPVIDATNNYIGKGNKGIFPLWVKVLKNYKPQPFIKHYKDIVYKDLLNQKVKGLNLSKDASEFRKEYKRLNSANIELDIKAILSQYSQSGKLGK